VKDVWAPITLIPSYVNREAQKLGKWSMAHSMDNVFEAMSFE
jgi:hypothetical protein